jgi:hypothetical protein
MAQHFDFHADHQKKSSAAIAMPMTVARAKSSHGEALGVVL